MQGAPFRSDVARGPENGSAYWLTAADGLRLRMGVWPGKDPQKGTILLFPGRTEYIEKYGLTAQSFNDQGYAMIAVDWRGQGMADRLLDDPFVGHVGQFSDYQLDVGAVMDAVRQLGLPEPFHLIGHSMGGCIGLRALYEGLPVEKVAFTAPMWGILLGMPKPLGRAIAATMRLLRQQDRRAVTTPKVAYVLESPFENNTLTTDRAMWDYMVKQAQDQIQFTLAGPSFHWVDITLREMDELARKPAPAQPCLTFLGSNERIVDPQAIKDRMASWQNGKLQIIGRAEHEILMERPDVQQPAVAQIAAHFGSA